MTPRALVNAGRRAGLHVLRGEDDARLVELAGHGSEAAFEAIVERYRGRLVRYAAAIVGPDGADETVQESLVRAHTALARGDRVDRLQPWLHRIVRNAALNQVRDRGPHAAQLAECDASLDGPELVAERRQGLRDVLAGLRSLPRRQRDAIVLRELEGRSYDEIADHLGVSDPAVRGLLHRARTALRRAVAGLGPLWPGRLAELWGAGGASAPVPVRAGAAALVAAAAAVGGVTAVDRDGTEPAAASAIHTHASARHPHRPLAAAGSRHGAAQLASASLPTRATAPAPRQRAVARQPDPALDSPAPGPTPRTTSPSPRLEQPRHDGSREGPSPGGEGGEGSGDLNYQQPAPSPYVETQPEGSSANSGPGSYEDGAATVSFDSDSCHCDVNESRSGDGP